MVVNFGKFICKFEFCIIEFIGSLLNNDVKLVDGGILLFDVIENGLFWFDVKLVSGLVDWRLVVWYFVFWLVELGVMLWLFILMFFMEKFFVWIRLDVLILFVKRICFENFKLGLKFIVVFLNLWKMFRWFFRVKWDIFRVVVGFFSDWLLDVNGVFIFILESFEGKFVIKFIYYIFEYYLMCSLRILL